MHVSMNNIFKIFATDVLDNFFAQQFDQEGGRKKIAQEVYNAKKNQTSICLYFEKH